MLCVLLPVYLRVYYNSMTFNVTDSISKGNSITHNLRDTCYSTIKISHQCNWHQGYSQQHKLRSYKRS